MILKTKEMETIFLVQTALKGVLHYAFNILSFCNRTLKPGPIPVWVMCFIRNIYIFLFGFLMVLNN